MVILIDNGHGQETPGKCSPDGTLREYLYTRETAARIVRGLTRRGYDSRLLVTEEIDVPLSERCRRANAVCSKHGKENVLLVSVHVNAAGRGDQWMGARGWEAWTSPGLTRADRLADCLYDAASRCLPAGTPIRTDFTDGDKDKEARFALLTGTKCASVLTENLFQDNRREVEYLLSERGREALAALHVAGITDFISR